MNCMEVQKNINAFVEDKLEGKQLEAFLLHIRTCPSCREELEVYHTIFSGIKLLDEEKNINDRLDINKKIRWIEDNIRHSKMENLYKKILFILFILVISILLEK